MRTLASIAAIAAVLAAVNAFGQCQSCGSIAGAVFDSDGDPVPLAHMSLLPKASTDARTTVSSEDGKFGFPIVPAGDYKLVIQSVRLGRLVLPVIVTEGNQTDLPIVLTIAKQPASIRFFGRTFFDLVRDNSDLTIGQQGGDVEGYGPYGSRGNMSFNAIGQRGQDNNFLLDGLDNNESWTRGAILDPSTGSIDAMTVQTVDIPAGYGHAAGAVAAVFTRSGGNEFHGAAFDLIGNSAVDARNFFDGAKPGLLENRFGGNLGGPLRRDSWFFFFEAEGLRYRQGLMVISTVPTALQKSGNFGSTPIYDPLTITEIAPNYYARQPFTNNRVPLSRISPPSLALLALYPNPNLPGDADNYRYTPSAIQNQNRFDLRSDKTVTARDKLFVRFSYQTWDNQSPGAFPAAATLPARDTNGSDITQNANGGDIRTTAWGGIVSNTLNLSPTWINELRAGAARMDLDTHAGDQGVNASGLLGIPGLTNLGLPSVSPTGFTSLGSAGAMPFGVRNSNYQVDDSMSWLKSRQVWKFGASLIRRQVDGNASDVSNRGAFLFTPDYTSQPASPIPTGDSIASLLLGFPSETERDVQFQPYHLRSWEGGIFVQDQIQVSKRLTVLAGLRYDLYPPLTEANKRLVNFNLVASTPALNQFANQNGVSNSAGLEFNKKAISPRIGFAYDIFGDGSTVLRGGFSKDYDTGTFLSEGRLARNAPYASVLDMVNGTFQLGPSLTAGLPAPVALTLSTAAALIASQTPVYAIEPENYTPYADQWGLFLERRLSRKLTLEVGGTGSMGIHLYAAYDGNQPYPAPTPYATQRYTYQPYEGRVNYLAYGGGSTYYGGQAKLTGQLGRGLHLLLGYTFGKSLDDSVAPDTFPESRPPGPQDIFVPRLNRSPSSFDITQRAVLEAHYDLPAGKSAAKMFSAIISGWSIDTLITLQTGFPFTPELATNSLNNGGFQLPDRVGSGSLPASQRSYINWFNTNLNPSDPNRAFAIPAAYMYGDSGFNILRGPPLETADLALGRTFELSEHIHLRTRVEALNLLNHANLALPDRYLGVESGGVISHTITPSRTFQLTAMMAW